jgi:hypothetical protein
MSIDVILYDKSHFDEWNTFVDGSNNGTVFHRLDFLNYHEPGKFNFKNLMFYKSGELVAVLPAGMVKEAYKSPMGASFGGFVINKNLPLVDGEAIMKAFLDW